MLGLEQFAGRIELIFEEIVVFRYARAGDGYVDTLGLLIGLLEVGQ